jgi:hypothetical protein
MFAVFKKLQTDLRPELPTVPNGTFLPGPFEYEA